VDKESAMPAASHRKRPARELKKNRLELRVAASAKALIRRAMAVSGLTAGDLAYEGARRVLDEHERMVLTGANRDAFLEAVANPPEPAEALIAALRHHRDLVGGCDVGIAIEPFGKQRDRAELRLAARVMATSSCFRKKMLGSVHRRVDRPEPLEASPGEHQPPLCNVGSS
jgi:uncharacterized protein (DUF1778 family)